MGSDAKAYEQDDTSKNAKTLRAKYLGNLADTKCTLVIENEHTGDEVAWLNYSVGKCAVLESAHFIQSRAYGGHHTYPQHPIKGPFKCVICEAPVKIDA